MDSMNDFNMSLGKQAMDFCREHHLGKDAFLEILNKARERICGTRFLANQPLRRTQSAPGWKSLKPKLPTKSGEAEESHLPLTSGRVEPVVAGAFPDVPSRTS